VELVARVRDDLPTMREYENKLVARNGGLDDVRSDDGLAGAGRGHEGGALRSCSDRALGFGDDIDLVRTQLGHAASCAAPANDPHMKPHPRCGNNLRQRTLAAVDAAALRRFPYSAFPVDNLPNSML